MKQKISIYRNSIFRSSAAFCLSIILLIESKSQSETLLGRNGWQIVAHMSDKGGMFDGDSNLSPTYQFGTFVSNPSPETPDFYRPFPFSDKNTQILFISGNRKYWIEADYEKLLSIVNARKGEFGPNIDFNAGINGKPESTMGNVLSRNGVVEDPWISIQGEHMQAAGNNLIIWGDNDHADHQALKNNNGGIDVYIRKRKHGESNKIPSNTEIKYFNGHSYTLSEKKLNWQMAKKDAKKCDGYLVVINSSEEQKFLEKILGEAKTRENFCEPVWIGFSDERKEGNWKWVNGDKATFTYWQKNQPSNANSITPENYAVIWQPIDNAPDRGQWNDVAGDNQLRYITEYDFENASCGNAKIKIRTTR